MNATAFDKLNRSVARHTLVLFVLLLLVWLVLDGSSSVAVGIFFSLAAALAGAWLAPPSPRPLRLLRLPAFAVYFLIESVRGAIDVAWRAFRPNMPLDLRLVTYRLCLPAGKPRTLLVAVVSLLPGTLSAALDADRNSLLVHSLVGNPRPPVQSLERQIARLFAIELAET